MVCRSGLALEEDQTLTGHLLFSGAASTQSGVFFDVSVTPNSAQC